MDEFHYNWGIVVTAFVTDNICPCYVNKFRNIMWMDHFSFTIDPFKENINAKELFVQNYNSHNYLIFNIQRHMLICIQLTVVAKSDVYI